MQRTLLGLALLIAGIGVAHGAPYSFSTGTPDAKMGVASRLPSTGQIAIEAADDFATQVQTSVTSATFYGGLPLAADVSSVTGVSVEIYRVFPLDSVNPPSGQVPTRVNSPADVAFERRDSAASTLTYTVAVVNSNFTIANSVVNGIHPIPNQTTGGEGAVTSEDASISATFDPPLLLPSGHYFFVPQALLGSGSFLLLSAPKFLILPGMPLVPDLQSWTRNEILAPDWLRVGTDIVGGASTFNHAFTLTGTDDTVFGNGFD